MLSACNRYGEVQAAEVEVEDGPFHCPACQGSVILKQGRIKIPHFAHLTGTECVYSNEGESEEHQLAKLEIYAALRRTPEVTDVRLERYLQEVRPDVSFVVHGELVAIEIQFSHLSGDQIAWRTEVYARKHIAVLWTPSFPMELFEGRYAPKDWERYLHTLYYGRVYYWLEEVKLVPVKFEEYTLPPNWYSVSGVPSAMCRPACFRQYSFLTLLPSGASPGAISPVPSCGANRGMIGERKGAFCITSRLSGVGSAGTHHPPARQLEVEIHTVDDRFAG